MDPSPRFYCGLRSGSSTRSRDRRPLRGHIADPGMDDYGARKALSASGAVAERQGTRLITAGPGVSPS